MSLEIIKNKYLDNIKSILSECNFTLYEINIVKDFESNILQVLVENEDANKKNIDFDSLIEANEKISNWLDSVEELTSPYILEVSSAGAEKQVKNIETLKNNVNNFFFVKTKKPIESFNEFNATLTEVSEEDEFIFNFFIKGRAKKIKLKWDDISFIRFAIKF